MNFSQLSIYFDKLNLQWAKTSQKRYVKYLQKKGVLIGNNCKFFGGLRSISIDLSRPSLIEIGDNVVFNKNFKLLTHDYVTKIFIHTHGDFLPSSGFIKIGNNVNFGQDCIVLKNVKIGDNSFIGLGSIVSSDIPSNSIAIGRPARVIATVEEFYEKRKKECISEALFYAKSIQLRFNRRPVIEDFWEEFPLFLNGDSSKVTEKFKFQLGPAYENWKKKHISPFKNFDDFLSKAGIE